MKLYGDGIMLEFQKEEWELEKKGAKIITIDSVKEKEEGKFQERAPVHFFKVICVGNECKFAKPGDRLIPKPPDLTQQFQMQPTILYENGKKVVKYGVLEKTVMGTENDA